MDVGVVSEVGLFGWVHFLCEPSCSRDKVTLSVGLTSGADLAPCPLRSRWRERRSVGIVAISQCRAGGDARALGSSNPGGYAHLHSSGDRVWPLLRPSVVRWGHPAENGTRGPPPPPAALLTSFWFGAFVFLSLHGLALGRGVPAPGAAACGCSLGTVRRQHAQAGDGSPARPQFRVCLIPSSSPCGPGPLVV
ncbi:hypothetical protein NDU88_007284 [Pleurodeles waltl]|uniref:Uncharacterized protein n=1 Tax=Pleurodeles waltl TaxID=8319 RepID=A0AAV7N3M3_PLEWA|nr:hypothetical protein NDU88_007284 [Pleurodeles waltl]